MRHLRQNGYFFGYNCAGCKNFKFTISIVNQGSNQEKKSENRKPEEAPEWGWREGCLARRGRSTGSDRGKPDVKIIQVQMLCNLHRMCAKLYTVSELWCYQIFRLQFCPECVILHWMDGFTHNWRFYTQCMILHKVFGLFTLFCCEIFFVTNYALWV